MTDPSPLTDAAELIELLDDAARVVGETTGDGCAVRLPARGRLIATGDLHDNTFHLRKIVDLARLDASPDHHVVVHELIHGDRLVNGMDFSYRMLGRVAELVIAHPGQVHPVLANHELSQMIGKGVSKGAGNSVELFRDALDFVFGERCEDVAAAVNRFIRAMPLAVIVDGCVLCAHSLPAARLMARFDPGVLDRALRDEDYVAPHGAAYLMTWGRGTSDEQVEALAERWDVRLFCLGHEHVEAGIDVRGSRIVILNSDHAQARVLPIDLAAVPTAADALMYAIPLSAL